MTKTITKRKVRTEKYPHFLLRRTIEQKEHYLKLEIKDISNGFIGRAASYGMMHKQFLDLEMAFNI